MFDRPAATCRLPACPPTAPTPATATNLWYHIPRFAEFLLDHAYIQGNNNVECNSEPGTPFIGANGGTSCFKGWFVRYVMVGPVSQFHPCDGRIRNAARSRSSASSW